MSQFYQGVTAGALPPSVPTSFVTDNGTAVPAANILKINGLDSTENNSNGIIVKGGVAGTGTANEVDVVITNRLRGSSSTIGAATADVITLSLGATPGTYTFDVKVSGYASTASGGPLSVGYTIVGAVRTTGAVAVLIGGSARDDFEEGALSACNFAIVASGNNAIFRATGAAGTTIAWQAVGEYVFSTEA